MLGVGLTIPAVAARSRRFDPIARLGSSVYAYFDAERPESLSLSGSNVTSWRDLKNGLVVNQSTSGSKPIYTASAFNGRPGITFDGTDDHLISNGTGGIPTGAAPLEMWVLADNKADANDSTARRTIAWGSTSNNDSMMNFVSQAKFTTSAGTGSATVGSQPVGSSFGRHVMRGRASGTLITSYIDNVTGPTWNAVPAITGTKLAIGAMPVPSVFAYFLGSISAIIITAPLSTADANWMLNALKARGGIA
jgi:hypothetical protein